MQVKKTCVHTHMHTYAHVSKRASTDFHARAYAGVAKQGAYTRRFGVYKSSHA